MAAGSTAGHLDEETALALANGDLALELREAAVSHLDACPRCRQWVSVLGGEVTQNAAEPTQIRRPGELLEGERLGEYEVTGRIAEGGMGAVYKARQQLLGKNVAIKVLLPHVAADPGLVDRLLIEARAVNAIRHPNVIDVFSFGQTESGQHYFVMEFLEGETLSKKLHTAGRLTPIEAVELLEQICAGLSAVHGAGVLHRDLKPGNIFLTPLSDGAVHVKLLDFGLAKRQRQSRTSATLNDAMGTAGYMAPEQISGKPVMPQSDLYSVGVIAFRMLTGQAPFDAPSELDLLLLHMNHDAPRMTSIVPEVPPELDGLVGRLLEREWAKRPGSAAEVRRELQRISRNLSRAQTVIRPLPVPLGATPVGATAIGAVPPTERVPAITTTVETEAVERAPEPSIAARVAIVGVLVACAAAAVFWLTRPAPPPVTPPPPNVAVEQEPPAPPVADEPPPTEAPVPETPPPSTGNPKRPVKKPAVVTAESVRARLREARARTAKLEAQGMRRIVESELQRLDQELAAGEAPAKVSTELQQVLKDYAVP